MRAFWGATVSFFLAFLGWFALAPLGLEVATSMGTCENQIYPPVPWAGDFCQEIHLRNLLGM